MLYRQLGTWTVLGFILGITGCGSSPAPSTPILSLGTSPNLKSFSLLAGDIGGAGNINGAGTQSAFNHPEGTAVDSNGTIYVADTFNNEIRKITPQGVVSVFAGGTQGDMDGTGNQAMFNGPEALAIDSSNNLYVADTNNNSIREITPSGVVSTIAGGDGVNTPGGATLAGKSGNTDGVGTQALFKAPGGIAVISANGQTYIYVSDTGNNILRVLNYTTPSGLTAPAWVTATLSITIQGTYSTIPFNTPLGIVADNGGNLFVADSGNHVLRTIECSFPGSNYCSSPVSSGPTTFTTPSGLVANSTQPSMLYVLDSGSNALYSLSVTYSTISPSTTPTPQLQTTATLLTGTPNQIGYQDGASSLLNAPTGLSLYAQNFYIADTGNNAIRSWSMNTAIMSTLAGAPARNGLVNGNAATARFTEPQQMAVDSLGNVYVADRSNNCIRKISPQGQTTTFAGGGSTGQTAGLQDGTGVQALFNAPVGVAVDSKNNVYVSDFNNNDIRKITPQAQVSTFAGVGYGAYLDSTGTSAAFGGPTGLAVDALDNLYVADTNSNTIRKITPQAQVSTIAGQGGSSGDQDGIGTQAQFNHPVGIAVAADGSVYVADTGNNSIRKILASGQVTTISGITSGYVDGPVASAEFNVPAQLAIDQGGDIYVADTMNNAIRKITPQGQVSTVIGNSGSAGILLNPLPGSLYQPIGLVLNHQGQLIISSDQAILMTH